MKVKTLTAIIVIALDLFLIKLGFWQLNRYHEKQKIMHQYEQRFSGSPISLQDYLKSTPGRFEKIKVTGQFVNEKTLLLLHRYYQERPGINQITPLKIAGDNRLLLVNRGWLKQADLTPINGTVTLTGSVYYPLHNPFMLGENAATPQQWPLELQEVDVKALTTLTGQAFYPFTLRLLADQPYGFKRSWSIVNMPPERHMAYAVQWFLMALVLLLMYGWIYFKDRKTDENA